MLTGIHFNRERLFQWSLFFAIIGVFIAVIGCQVDDRQSVEMPVVPEETSFEITGLDTEGYSLSAGYSKDNLTVYFILRDEVDKQQYITLEEGLESGLVTVKEQENAEVSKLEIDNQSDYPLFLQEGDRVVGGKQDRTIHTSLVIAAKSGPMPLPAFCVESGRWGGERDFKGANNTSLANINTRISAKYKGNQSEVWDSVAQNKAKAQEKLGTDNSNTSLTETMDSGEIKRITDEGSAFYSEMMKREPKAVGALFVINGEIVSVDVYAGQPLFQKVFPKLVGSISVDAALREGKVEVIKEPRREEVLSWLNEDTKVDEEKQVNANEGNVTDIEFNKDASAVSRSKWNNNTMHFQRVNNVREVPVQVDQNDIQSNPQGQQLNQNDLQQNRQNQRANQHRQRLNQTDASNQIEWQQQLQGRQGPNVNIPALNLDQLEIMQEDLSQRIIENEPNGQIRESVNPSTVVDENATEAE